MASLADLPKHLHEHARAMPKGLLDKLHPGEALHRLDAVHQMTESADRIANPAIHRHIRAHAKRLRDAMPHEEFTAERNKLQRLRDSAPNSDVQQAYMDALRDLEDKHEQVSGVGEAIMKWDKDNPANVSKAKAAAKAAAIQKAIDAATAEFARKQAEIRREIEVFKSERGIK
jgi:hypothetical protein